MAFQIVTDATQNHLIIGVGPFDGGTDFGSDYPIWVIDDDALYAYVIAHYPAYLCADRQTMQLEPC